MKKYIPFSKNPLTLFGSLLIIGLFITSIFSPAQIRNIPEYTSLVLPDQSYRIPSKEYNVFVQQYNAKNGQAAFGFDLILPDLLPSTSDPEETAQWGNGTGWHKDLHILMQYGVDTISQKKLMEDRFKESEDLKNSKIFIYKQYLDPNKYTLLPNQCKKFEGEFLGGDVMIVCGNGNTMWVTTCDSSTHAINLPSYKTSPYCQTTVKYMGKMQLTYAYGYQYIDHVVEIHNNLLKLLDSFRTK